MPRRKSLVHYHTFPTPPGSRSAPLGNSNSLSTRSLDFFGDDSRGNVSGASLDTNGKVGSEGEGSGDDGLPTIPKRQLLTLAVISLAEQTALNSISPYLPQMTGTFPEVDQQKVGLYVGIVASSFAAAQFASACLSIGIWRDVF